MSDDDLLLSSPLIVDIIVKEMLKRLPDNKWKFIFVFCFLQGGKQKDAAEILEVHETEISRQIKRIRRKLIPYARRITTNKKTNLHVKKNYELN